MTSKSTFPDIICLPDGVLVQQDSGWAAMEHTGGSGWAWKDVLVTTEPAGGELTITLQAEQTALSRIVLIWNRKAAGGMRLMGDHWERGYGDLEWRGIVPERVMPWFFLMHDGARTHGFGVKTGPQAMCSWQVNDESILLCLDVRCGGAGVVLGGRSIPAATVVTRQGLEGETPFQAARAFCALMCPSPVLPKEPVYGGNNWYYAYGKSSHNEILDDSKFISSLASNGGNRPFMVIDEGWALPRSASAKSLWQSGNALYPDMKRLAGEMKAEGVRPGIWVRPLSAPDNAPDALCLPPQRFKAPYAGKYLDPSLPEVLDIVRADIAWQAECGYELIKHDYTTFDLLGQWGFEMGGDLTNDGWHFHDTSKTTAEVITDLYRAIRQASGEALLIGCNTVGHIGAGLFELQRTGDDTSGRQWERTRKMGVNTLAFTLPKHGTFYAADADCAGITSAVPWELNRQWLELLAKSGTPLFVSASPAVGPEQQAAIRKAFEIASREIATAEPLDWMETTCPRKWRLHDGEAEFSWNRQDCIEFCRG